MTRREKIEQIRRQIIKATAAADDIGFKIPASKTAWIELGTENPNLGYVHNLLARAWGLPVIKAAPPTIGWPI